MPTADQSIRHAVYTRQSTTPETTLSSCEAQFSICQDFVTARKDHRWELLLRFQVAWGVLDFSARMRMLPEIVQRVIHREEKSSLEVTLDTDALKRLFPEPPNLAGNPPVDCPGC